MHQKAGEKKPEPIVLTQLQNHIGIVTMNNSGKLNTLSSELVQGILEAFDGFEEAKARVVILRAVPGVKVWSAGHNMKEMPLGGQDPVTWNESFQKLLHRVRHLPMPIIGLIEGTVWGGACDLCMTCDMLVGAPSATFAITPVKLGISYNTAGVSHFLGVLPTHIVKEMLFTAEPISAEVAYKFGLLNKLVEADKLEETAMQMAAVIASRAPLAVHVLRREIQTLTNGQALSPDNFEAIQELRREAYRSEDFKEGISSFFERRDPVFKGQ
ncbi:MAG: methylmalonyl-CoA decarboxylase [Deltaproteobacteria bacterium]|nr:methylmalonyl-CoA decarboxylase [Deltaproteobacteria bacterium]